MCGPEACAEVDQDSLGREKDQPPEKAVISQNTSPDICDTTVKD